MLVKSRQRFQALEDERPALEVTVEHAHVDLEPVHDSLVAGLEEAARVVALLLALEIDLPPKAEDEGTLRVQRLLDFPAYDARNDVGQAVDELSLWITTLCKLVVFAKISRAIVNDCKQEGLEQGLAHLWWVAVKELGELFVEAGELEDLRVGFEKPVRAAIWFRLLAVLESGRDQGLLKAIQLPQRFLIEDDVGMHRLLL